MFKTTCKVINLLCLCLILTNCSTNPATGKSQFTGFLSDEGAEDIGRLEHPKILQLYEGIYNEKNITDYVDSIGQKLARVSDMPEEDFKFIVLNKNMVNAFAMPGGYIYLGRGIIELANDEAELASVLAHEIAHITARHANSRYSQNTLFDIGELLLGQFVGYGSDTLLDLGSGLYLMSYSREQEHEADLLSVRYLAKAGYDSNGMSRFLAQLRRNSILEAKLTDEDISKVDEVSYFDTHPQTLKRIEEAKALAMREKDGVKNKAKYFNKINNLIYGQRAEQGFVRGQIFAHPELDIVFQYPEDYKIKNFNDRVIGKKRDNAIIFTVTPDLGIEDPKDYMYDVWLANLKKEVDIINKIQINGMNGVETSFYEDRKKINLMVLYNKEKKLYLKFIFDGVNENDTLKFEESIHRMSQEEKELYKDYKIKIITVQKGDTIKSLSNLMPFDDFKKERFLMINGLEEYNILQIGQKLKMVE